MSAADWILAGQVNLGLALACLLLGLLSPSGCLAAFLIGGLVWGSLGWRGWALLLAFFLAGTAATKFGYGKKARRGVAQAQGGQRRWNHAWANAGAAVFCALMALRFALHQPLPGDPSDLRRQAWTWAFVGCLAAALSDTLSSEFGQLSGKLPRLITTGKRVPHGTDGGITLSGTLVGLLGAAALSLLGRFVGLTPVRATLPLLLAGLSGNLLDSWLGATLQRRGRLGNDAVNFFNTCGGAALGFLGFWIMRWLPLALGGLGLGGWQELFR